MAIAVPLSRLFDYRPPADGPVPGVGERVRVGFGRRRLIGLVMEHAARSDIPPERLKRVDRRVDRDALLDGDSLWLLRFAADYYHHPIGEVVATALPALLRHGGAVYPTSTVCVATPGAADADVESLAKRAPRQAELLQLLLDAGDDGLDRTDLDEVLPNWRRALGALRDKGYVATREQCSDDALPASELSATPGPSLNPAQQAAVDTILADRGFSANVLDGVTGSGKTEVYLRLIADCIARGRQALVLVPEIGLTPQLVTRFRTRLGVEPVLLHSGLTDNARLAAWRRARSGDAPVIVGTRSAVFVPLARPGLVVVDEEHDHSFKQQDGLRYSARDLAIARGKRAGVPVVLGSATPTLEMQKHCLDDNYRHLRLPARAGGATAPVIRLVDTRRFDARDGLSDPVRDAIRSHLEADGQVLMFLNRRGFAPTLICSTCGHIAGCRRCDARLTVHASASLLRCHHCGAQRPLDVRCEACGEPARPLGAGTERLEETLQNAFPGRTVTRIDSDSVQRRGAMADALEAATAGSADILVGTQMLSKGHHFPKLTLVCVVNADQGLFGTDFRSDERMAQAIVQVAGRAGRERRQGEVLIQTAFPDHPFWRRLVEGGYAGVAADAYRERAATHWPPFSRLALIRASAHRRADAHAFLESARRQASTLGHGRLDVLGPVDAVMARKAGRYRAQLLLRSADRSALHSVLRVLRPALEEDPAARRVRWSVDVDPGDLA